MRVTFTETTMPYAVIVFDDDKKITALPATWFTGEEVHLPPLSGKGLRAAIMNSLPLDRSWEAHKASRLATAGKL